MRIIGGIAAGRILKVPKGLSVRPTPDLVRQAVFNSLGARVIDANVLDLFSGTGAIGLECLSRGAQLVVSVEKNAKNVGFIKQNIVNANLQEQNYELRTQDVFTAIAQLVDQKRQFDLITADPPFGKKNIGTRSLSLSQKLLDDPNLCAVLADDGLLVLGHTTRDTLTIPDHWKQVKVLKHGDSMMHILGIKK
ncbi:MAG: 16S rRNA (guanine(966)-N(2))-methyltransferase RsmD [Verrucomicrobia bacterium]|nr:16S rRNA (guanine(966)-N(2))-methyltransferase RsmD [Verrucomicrobiota bacterium]MCF7708567.1 16S rRNA (guanine(966)-N(2))-methyltransferase RsmD [Verrucomicrobiota bacterium]